MRGFSIGHSELILAGERLHLPGKDCVILETRHDGVAEGQEKHLKSRITVL
jgi:hypothetical protein